MRLKYAETKQEKIDALKKYVEDMHERQKVDYSCQYKGGNTEKFCRATSQKSCCGCRFYSMRLYNLLPALYDIVAQKNRRIVDLESIGVEEEEFK